MVERINDNDTIVVTYTEKKIYRKNFTGKQFKEFIRDSTGFKFYINKILTCLYHKDMVKSESFRKLAFNDIEFDINFINKV